MFNINLLFDFLYWMANPVWKLKKRCTMFTGTSPSLTTIRYWFHKFKLGRTSVSDEERSGRRIQVTAEEMIEKIHGIVLNDRRINVREIVDIVGILHKRVLNNLHQQLEMKKLSARWVLRLLIVDQKRIRMDICKKVLCQFQRNPTDFLRRFITVGEIWVRHYTPETKQQSKQWISHGKCAPKKAKAVLSARKVMATAFGMQTVFF